MPSQNDVSASVSYGLSSEIGQIEEDRVALAERRVTGHSVTLRASYAPIPVLAVGVEANLTPSQRWRYAGAPPARLTALAGRGTFLPNDGPPNDVTIRASGLESMWFDVATGSELPSTQQIRWRIRGGVRLPSPGSNRWVANGDRRGASYGSAALRWGAAVSSEQGRTHPYLSFDWVEPFNVTVDAIDESGELWAADLLVSPARTLELHAGAEVVVVQREGGARFAVDGSLGALYRADEQVTSGLYLPNVLPAGRAFAVTTDDTVALLASLALDVQGLQRAHIRTGFDFALPTPTRLEHIYDVQTSPGTWRIGWFLRFGAAHTL